MYVDVLAYLSDDDYGKPLMPEVPFRALREARRYTGAFPPGCRALRRACVFMGFGDWFTLRSWRCAPATLRRPVAAVQQGHAHADTRVSPGP